ncbi:hypothetical protein DFH08DRAFT_1034298, partial [Mycena albidolilacea]
STRGDIHPAHASSIPRCRRPGCSSASPIAPDSPAVGNARRLLALFWQVRASATAARTSVTMSSTTSTPATGVQARTTVVPPLDAALSPDTRYIDHYEKWVLGELVSRGGRASVQLAVLHLILLLYAAAPITFGSNSSKSLAQVQYGRQETNMEPRSCSGVPLLCMGY